LYERLTEIDDLTRPDHSFLVEGDRCFYMGEYTAVGGFGASTTNNLVQNLKKPMDRRNLPEWRYKIRAINTFASELGRLLGRSVETLTFVPVPPSKARTDPEYDDRLVQILNMATEGRDADLRELLVQRTSMQASHTGAERTSIDALVANYDIDPALSGPPRPDGFVIFDDMLTTGRHFKAVQRVITGLYPTAPIFGLFIARRLPNASNLEDFL